MFPHLRVLGLQKLSHLECVFLNANSWVLTFNNGVQQVLLGFRDLWNHHPSLRATNGKEWGKSEGGGASKESYNSQKEELLGSF